MSYPKRYIASIVDAEGQKWMYEGRVQDNPIWVKEEGANPRKMTEHRALDVAKEQVGNGEQILIEEFDSI